MKKFIVVFLLIVSSLIQSNSLQASQIDGGQIHWYCIEGTGKYVFYMEVYRDCSSEPFSFTNQYLKVSGASVDSILLKPDLPTFALYNDGNISSKGSSGCQKVCANDFNGNSDPGAMQFFPFVSDPISLSGIPPSTGWEFSWSSCCRDSSQANLAINSTTPLFLKAVMYPFKNTAADHCYNSSPFFIDLHVPNASLGSAYNFNHTASDVDLDSLVFSFDSILSLNNNSNPYRINWETGYTSTSPFPGPNQDASNTAVSLDDRSGHISGAVHSFNSIGKKYAYSLRVDAYREGIKIASIWKNAILSIKSPDTLNTGQINKKPIIKINGMNTNNYHITAFVGDTLSIPIKLMDADSYFLNIHDSSSLTSQEVNLRPEAMLFSRDFIDTNDCFLRDIEPCATLKPAPKRNVVNGERELHGPDSIKTTFNWQISCNALSYYEDSRLHTFVLASMDDHCPTEIQHASLSVDVKIHFPEISRNGNVLSVQNASGIRWYFNDSLLLDSNVNSINIIGIGRYSVSAKSFCRRKVYYDVQSVGITENRMNAVKIYPNPFKATFTLELPSEVKDFQLSLQNIQGKQVHINTLRQGNQVIVSTNEVLPMGIYFLNISDGDQQVYKKLIKH